MIWERQPTDTAKSWAAFVVYRDLPAGTRSLEEVRQKLGNSSGYTRQLEKWSAAHNWVARVAAYDAHLDAERLAAAKALRDEQWERLYAAAPQLVDEALSAVVGEAKKRPGSTRRSKASKEQVLMIRDLLDRIGLKAPTVTRRTEETTPNPEGGTTTKTTEVSNVDELGPADLAREYRELAGSG